jgi:hypothetical protein
VRYAVIPTRFDRETLAPLVQALQPICTVVIVHTEPDHPHIQGTVRVEDFSPSIQHWWNSGLDQCDGPTLVLNDDIEASTEDLEALFGALDHNDVVYVAGHRIGHRTPLTGWCYGIHPDRIRPDEAFGWWAGDDDLFLRAMAENMAVAAIHLPNIVHKRIEAAFGNPVHAAMVDADMKLLAERWG